MAGDQGGGRADSPPGLDVQALEPRLAAAIAEDLGLGDITSCALISGEATGEAAFVARQAGVICGLPLVEPILRLAAECGAAAHLTSGVRVCFWPSPLVWSFQRMARRRRSGSRW